VNGLLERLFTVRRLDDADELRRARLHVGAALLVFVYLVFLALEGMMDHNGPLIALALGSLLPAGGVLWLSRQGRLRAAETMIFALMLAGTLALLAVHGPVPVRLGIVLVGLSFLGLAVRPWRALTLGGFAVAAVLGSVYVPALHALSGLSPDRQPSWLSVERQILFTTALILVFTHGFRRLLSALSRHSAELEAAHAVQLAARDRLERLVAERSKELERANADLAAFASAASHDLRAPLRHVSGFLEIFEEDNAELGLTRLTPLIEARELVASMVLKLDGIIAESRRSVPPEGEGES
jgi:signal transduction histidine kinase